MPLAWPKLSSRGRSGPHGTSRASSLLDSSPAWTCAETTAAAIAALKTWQRTVSRRRAIADLPSDRLKDIGHAKAPAPVLEVKAGLITNLMSVR